MAAKRIGPICGCQITIKKTTSLDDLNEDDIFIILPDDD